jgi:hypothetical protein
VEWDLLFNIEESFDATTAACPGAEEFPGKDRLSTRNSFPQNRTFSFEPLSKLS